MVKASVTPEAKAVAKAIREEIRKEGIVKWSLTEDQCMLFAVYNVLDSRGKELLTCGGTIEPRQLLNSVMGGQGRTLLRGVNGHDVLKMLWKVVENNRARGKNVRFTWQRTGFNVKSRLGWDVSNLKKSVLNKIGKKFVIIGKTRRQTEKHKKWMQHAKTSLTEDEVVEEWGKTAKGLTAVDHAIGIRVEENSDATMIVDNGCTFGLKKFTMHNLADRMEDLCVCYQLALYEM
jgi:hypothetical protein